MKKQIILFLTTTIILFSIQSYAGDKQERMYLIQLINQIEAMKPLVIAAENEQVKNLRIQFHYTSYQDNSGKLHSGLLDDINEIEKGIREKLSQTSTEPHRFSEIKGDYLDNTK